MSLPVPVSSSASLPVSLPVSRSALSRSPVPLALAGLALATVPAGSAAARPPVKPYTLTATQERTVLRLVDDVCGDTWCEGDHAFRFHRFSCDPRRERCALAISIAPYDEQPRRWRSRSLRITGFPRYADMVRTGPDGHRALQDPFYEAVGTAVRAAEASVR